MPRQLPKAVATNTVNVTIPPGVRSGQSFQIQVQSTGQILAVVVPPGCGPGTTINVQIPDVPTVVANLPSAVPLSVPSGPISQAEIGRQLFVASTGPTLVVAFDVSFETAD